MATITCKGAICWGPEEPLTVEDIQVDPPKTSEVRIRMLCASLCHTDLLFRSGFPLKLYPRILGHEGVGVVESIGKGVEGVKEGDTVIPCYMAQCGECSNCTCGKTNVCFKYVPNPNGVMPDGTSRMSVKGQKLYHFLTCSTFSQYTVVNAAFVVKVDPRVAPPHASIISCSFTTGFGAVWKEAKVEKASTVAVFGLGGVGIGAVAAAKSLGASKIIGVDLNKKKKGKGKAFGMTDFIDPKEFSGKPLADVIKEMTFGLGVDYCFECTGVASLANQALEAVTPGRGVAVLVGSVKEMSLPINPKAMMAGQTLKGSLFGGIKPQSDLPFIINKSITKEFDFDGMVTHQVDLVDINRAFGLVMDLDCVKVVIKMDGIH